MSLKSQALQCAGPTTIQFCVCRYLDIGRNVAAPTGRRGWWPECGSHRGKCDRV